MINREPADQRCIISMSPPTRPQLRGAAWVAGLMVAAVVLTAPFAQTRLHGTTDFLSVYASVVFVNDLVTAVMLLAVFSVQCSRALLVIAVAYLFNALTIIPWILTFPGAFPGAQAEAGLLGGGIQSTATISAARIYGFPLLVIAYALLKNRETGGRPRRRPGRSSIIVSVAAVVAAVCGLTWVSVRSDELLLPLMVSHAQTAPLWSKVLIGGMLLSAAALLLLLVRRRSALDVWLCVVLLTSLLESLLLGFLSAGRLSAGWWAGRIYGLAASSVVLIVLLSEMTVLYARLVNSVSSERRAREDRLLAMEALSASVAHEISQPLASMVINAEAGLRWLVRPAPDVAEAREALQRIAQDGNRAADVIANIRAVFRKGTAERVPVAINELITDLLSGIAVQLAQHRITTTVEAQAGLPAVMGNPIQLQQLLSNLVTNAVEAMDAVSAERRSIRIGTARQGAGLIAVSIEDSGPGLDPQRRNQVLETIFTTKQNGSGMGLVISRSIVEAHGGHISLENSRHGGAVCRFTLKANP